MSNIVEFPGVAVKATVSGNLNDPLAGYLRCLVWDGVPRIGTWLYDICGAPASSAAIGSEFLISAVARALDPGCGYGTMLVLVNPHGVGKSTAIKILGGEFGREGVGGFSGRDAELLLASYWITEVYVDVAVNHKAKLKAIEVFLEGKFSKSRPPRAALIGTYRGRRRDLGPRFCLVDVGSIDLDRLSRDRDQLFAEAVQHYLRRT